MPQVDRVHGLVGSLGVKAPVRAATTANITLYGTQTIDGVALAADDRVLVKDQTTGSENGIWACKATTWERTADFDDARDVVPGTMVVVAEGTLRAGAVFNVTNTGTITIGTTSLTFDIVLSNELANGTPSDNTVSTAKLQDDAVTFAKMQNIATGTLIGRSTAATGSPEALTVGAGLDLTAGELDLAAAANPVGKQPIWIPAGAWTPQTTNGPSRGSVELTTNKQMLSTLDFDSATAEYAQFSLRAPKAWNESTVTYQPIWSHPSTTTNFGVAWQLEALCVSDGDANDAAWGTGIVVTDTGGTTSTNYAGAESSAVTAAGTPAEGDLVRLRISRQPANGSDTMAVDARLEGVMLWITTNAATDA